MFVLFYYWRASMTEGSVDKHANSQVLPSVTADNGILSYNSVRVKVPTEGASYSVGYDWAKEDKEYPSVPSSASACYNSSADQIDYEVVLYRDKVIAKDDKDTNSVGEWFSDWEPISDENVEQRLYKAKTTEGVLVYNLHEENEKKYCSYTYYFVAETDKSVEQYVLEMTIYNLDLDAEALFKSCADSIKIK